MEILYFKKKVFFFTAMVTTLAISMAAVATAEFNPQTGLYYRYDSSGVTFHTYTTPIAFGASCSVVIETPNKLIVQDVQQNRSNNLELIALIKSLNKPVDRIVISHGHDHHWTGLEMFPGIPVHASAATIADMEKNGEAALSDLKKQYGEDEVPYQQVVIPTHVLTEGEVLIDGVKIVFGSPMVQLTGPVTFMEFPDQGVLIHHHLAYAGVHVPMPPAAMRVQALESLKTKGYKYLIGGHGIPSKADKFFADTIGYFTKVDQVVKRSANPEAAVAAMKEAYPDWGAVFLLEMFMPANFKN